MDEAMDIVNEGNSDNVSQGSEDNEEGKQPELDQ